MQKRDAVHEIHPRPTPAEVAVVACLAFAANSKLTMIPVVAILGLVVFALLAARLARGGVAGPSDRGAVEAGCC